MSELSTRGHIERLPNRRTNGVETAMSSIFTRPLDLLIVVALSIFLLISVTIGKNLEHVKC